MIILEQTLEVTRRMQILMSSKGNKRLEKTEGDRSKRPFRRLERAEVSDLKDIRDQD